MQRTASKARLPEIQALSEARSTLIWAMVGDRPGDTAQVLAVTRAAELPFEVRPVVPIGGSRQRSHPKCFAPIQLDVDRSAYLEPPWPDLVISVGQWPTAAALWVQDRSGGRTQLVLIGRPKPEQLHRFALVLVPSHYRVPSHPAVMRVDFPPTTVDRDEITRAAVHWQPYFERLARPLTAVFVGGETKPFRLDEEVARSLAERVRTLIADEGGSAYVVTSPRTDRNITRTLTACLPHAGLFDFASGRTGDNPYRALLGCADRFIVTGDSVSMMVEVASLGRPLAIFPLPKQQGLGARFGYAARKWLSTDRANRSLNVLSILAHRLCGIGFPRDIEALHKSLYSRGLAVPLGCPFLPPGRGFETNVVEIRSLIQRFLST
jgi:uncharacterized protein